LGERLKGQVMIAPDDIAELVVFLLRQPENLDVAEVVVRRFDAGAKQRTALPSPCPVRKVRPPSRRRCRC